MAFVFAAALALAGFAFVLVRLGFHQRIPMLLRCGEVDLILDRAARQFGQRTILELERPLCWKLPESVPDSHEELKWSAVKLRDTAALIAGALKTAIALEPNDRVAICKENHFDFFVFSSAICRAGAVSAPVNGGLSTEAMGSYLRTVGARAVFADIGMIRRFLAEGGSFGEVAAVLVVDSKTTMADGTPEELAELIAMAKSNARIQATVFHSLEALLARAAGASRFEPAVRRGGQDPMYIVHTSGTTGHPKAVIVQKRGLAESLRATALFNLVSRRDLACFSLPFNHQVTHLYLNAMLAFGAKAVLVDSFDPAAVLNTIASRKVAVYFGFPITYTQLAAQDLSRYDLSRMRMWGTTADASHEVHQRAFIRQGSFFRAFGLPIRGSLFVDGLGSSEVGIAALLRITGPWTRKFGRRVGRPVPFFGPKVKVVDAERKPLPVGKPGRLMIRGRCLFAGYWNAHDKFYGTSFNGWWFTGDLVRKQRDGCYVHLDREADVIHHRNGVSYTLLIEEEILKHPAVYDASVFAWPQPGNVVAPAAVIALKEGWAPVSAEQLRGELNAALPPNDQLHRVTVLPWRDFPKGVTGKALKRALVECA